MEAPEKWPSFGGVEKVEARKLANDRGGEQGGETEGDCQVRFLVWQTR